MKNYKDQLIANIKSDEQDVEEMSYLKGLYPEIWWWFDDQMSFYDGQQCRCPMTDLDKLHYNACAIEAERIFLIMMEKFHKIIKAQQ
jgi:hypothetical protein